MEQNKFTPSSLSATEISFSIPLYQRLFEWEEKEIQQLLTDLHNSYMQRTCFAKPYYIGMLTANIVKNQILSLVDGQQRFTVLTLMALAFDTEKWNGLLKTPTNQKRLSFFARKHDSNYLQSKIEKSENTDYVNRKMENGISTIKKFVNGVTEQNDFINYIFENATFFISKLPTEYISQDLNRYFETVNSAGRSLENHEILKVNLLKRIDSKDQEFYTKIWNATSEMDKCLVRQRTWDNETVDGYRNRCLKALNTLQAPRELFQLCNHSSKTDLTDSRISIKSITINEKKPSRDILTSSERAILNFSEFLLQIFWIQLNTEERKKTNDFFNIHKLQETFKKHLSEDKTVDFFNNLLKYRILFDQFVLRITYSEQNNSNYLLNFSGDDSDKSLNNKLLQFQSMLYVSTSSNLWLSATLKYLENNYINVSAESYLTKLKSIDNKRRCKGKIDLCYGRIDRYWFWRLDYYLWESQENYFNEISLKISNKYIFRGNRSIEHVAPQNPKTESEVQIDNSLLHSFGNLAMISSGQNSSLQNESFEIKQAHVKTFIKGKGSSIESLKMLKIYEYENWSEDNLIRHSNEMITVLIDSFQDEEELYGEVIANLRNQLKV